MPLKRLPLAVAVTLALVGADSRAQSLPRRDNLEAASIGDANRDTWRDRHVFTVAPGRPLIAPISGDRVLDLERIQGELPDVWSSQGGALLLRGALEQHDANEASVDTLGSGHRWLRLESEERSKVVVHARVDARAGGADPWLVPLAANASQAERLRPGRVDRVLEIDESAAVYRVPGGPLRLDVWRTQRPRLQPPEATWLRLIADGRIVFDGRVPTPVEAERLYVTDGCATVLDLAGRVRIDLPADARELRVEGEPGTWLKVLAPLPGTPMHALEVETEPQRDQLVAAFDESVDDAFDRAARLFPDPRAQVFLGRHGYLRDVALRPEDGGTLSTRMWRARFVDHNPRDNLVSGRPIPGDTAIGSTAFNWLAAGARWRIDTAVPARAGLLRIAVAHPRPATSTISLQLDQGSSAPLQLRLDPAIVDLLGDGSSSADALLAVDPQGAPIVDASQAVLPRMDLATPTYLSNTGTQGAWIAVEQRVPAPRQVDRLALVARMTPERLQDALVGPANDHLDVASDPATTRDLRQARTLLAARAVKFAGDPCVSAAASDPAAAARALNALGRAGDDPLLARCAALQAIAAAPGDTAVQAAFDRWAREADQAELRTGAYARAVQLDPGVRDPGAWARLAVALRGENQHDAAAFASLAAGLAPSAATTGTQDAGIAEEGAASVRLATDRGTELTYTATRPGRPVRWRVSGAGLHMLELRATATSPQWVRLSSGQRRWWTLLPAADDGATGLRDIATGRPPGLAIRVPLTVSAAGQVIEVEAVDGEVLSRMEDSAPVATASTRSSPAATGVARFASVHVTTASACRIDRLQVPLERHAPGLPVATAEGPGAIVVAADAPVIGEDGTAGTATQAALLALRQLDAGAPGVATAVARAYALRESERGAPAPGVFAELDRYVSWRLLEPIHHGGLRRREVADGRSTAPLIARREGLAGLQDDSAFVLRPGQGWLLEGLQPGQGVRLTLRLQAVLTDAVQLRTTRGETVALEQGSARSVVDTADADGALHLRLDEALPGTFVSMHVADIAGTLLDGRVRRSYHAGPVRVSVPQPTLLRILEWDGVRSTARTQWVAAAGTVEVSPQVAGNALRITSLGVRSPEPRAPKDAAAATSAVQPLARHATAGPVHGPRPGSTPASRGDPSSPRPAGNDVPSRGAAGAGANSSAPPPPTVAPWRLALPASGGEDGTWGVQTGWQHRIDADGADNPGERFGEMRWRWRRSLPQAGLWNRVDAVIRRHDDGARVFGLQHALQWRQADGPYGATLDAAAWRQSKVDSLGSAAHALSLRAAVDWSRVRDERWRDQWELGVRWRDQSLEGLDGTTAAQLDNDVYSRYRDTHRRQADVAYQLVWRARYDTELVFGVQAVSNELPRLQVDRVGATLGSRWARDGWTASVAVDARRYLADNLRPRARDRQRLEIDAGRLWLGADDGWRLRVGLVYDAHSRKPSGSVVLEWFDHDGRGLDDFAPSEMFLRAVTEADLMNGPPAPTGSP